MENPEKIEDQKLGVSDVNIKDGHYSVDIRWKNGKTSQHNFPEKGFGVYDPETHHKLDFISGKDALEILRKHSPLLDEEDFSWTDYVNQKGKKGI